jgi:hypothetical protein
MILILQTYTRAAGKYWHAMSQGMQDRIKSTLSQAVAVAESKA